MKVLLIIGGVFCLLIGLLIGQFKGCIGIGTGSGDGSEPGRELGPTSKVTEVTQLSPDEKPVVIAYNGFEYYVSLERNKAMDFNALEAFVRSNDRVYDLRDLKKYSDTFKNVKKLLQKYKRNIIGE